MRFLIMSLLSVALLAACGGGQSPPSTPAQSRAIAPSVVTHANFGDAKPHPFGGREPATYQVHGIDASRWNGVIDWTTAKANGVNFGFLKATEGGDLVDPMFDTNWRGARQAGVPIGAYHFWYHCRPAAEQARWFIKHVPKVSGALPPVLDMEWTPFSPTCKIRPPAEHIRREAKIFLNMLEAHYGQRPIIYSAPDFFDVNEMWLLGDYNFWLRSVAAHPQDLFGGRHWAFWQYTSTGLVPGMQGRSDINVFAGNATQWQDWLARHLSR